MPRPKKKLPPVAAAVAMDTDDADDAAAGPSKPDSSAPPELEPEPEPKPEQSLDDDFEQCKFLGHKPAVVVRWHRRKMVAAEKHFQKVKRSWERKEKTYFHSGKYSPFDFPSVVKRVEQRLFEADVELGEAWAEYVRRKDRWVAWRSYALLEKRYFASLEADAHDPILEHFWERAMQRLEDLPTVTWKSYWKGLHHDIWDWNSRNFGLAVSYGLTHTDLLKPPDLPKEQRRELDASFARWNEAYREEFENLSPSPDRHEQAMLALQERGIVKPVWPSHSDAVRARLGSMSCDAA